ncbi:helix-turn-helix domain-containing protein [Sphingobacterium composti Ten et al. 2007 non Yoo et al. 2007]|uniref:helix-turn-helix domain-containing protein n=1 Tax=Sphingobacterium composti TaxID=363260 RepID=UPI00135832C5|nr:helix-turn-helix domain-containing protein [Sphingobacterium composti Ten et al. 2007 non Yoo et al. 2007]
MRKSVLQIQRSDATEIKKLLNTNDAYTVGIRLYMVYLVALGYSSRRLSELHNISFKQITNWVHRFEKEGVEGLKDKKGRGRRSNLSNEQLERIKNLVINENPSDHGYQSVKWTGPLLAQWIDKEYGLTYQKAQVYNLLEKVGIVFEKKKGLVYKV